MIKIVRKLLNEITTIECVKISGGEPLLFPKLDKLVTLCDRSKKISILQTNGLLLTKSIANNLKRAGLNKVQLSLDGSKYIHNKLRGKNFDQVLMAAKACKTNNLPFYFKCTISELNKNEIENLFKIAKNYSSEKLNFGFVMLVGKAKNNPLLKEVTKQDKKRVIRNIYNLTRKYKVKIVIADPCAHVYLQKHLRHKKIVAGGTCNLGSNSIHISSDGYYRPCSMINLNLGDALQDNFYEIWNKHKFLTRCRERDFGKCKKCKNINFCGGCRANAFSIHNDYFAKDSTCFLF
jgi:radical SAM protein with 4Fe4S-binding SPASM domain